MIAYFFWCAVLAVVALIFRGLWKLAAKIEAEEEEDRQWTAYINQMWQIDPYQGMYAQQLYEQRRMR